MIILVDEKIAIIANVSIENAHKIFSASRVMYSA